MIPILYEICKVVRLSVYVLAALALVMLVLNT
jgi:hypothetical protein